MREDKEVLENQYCARLSEGNPNHEISAIDNGDIDPSYEDIFRGNLASDDVLNPFWKISKGNAVKQVCLPGPAGELCAAGCGGKMCCLSKTVHSARIKKFIQGPTKCTFVGTVKDAAGAVDVVPMPGLSRRKNRTFRRETVDRVHCKSNSQHIIPSLNTSNAESKTASDTSPNNPDFLYPFTSIPTIADKDKVLDFRTFKSMRLLTRGTNSEIYKCALPTHGKVILKWLSSENAQNDLAKSEIQTERDILIRLRYDGNHYIHNQLILETQYCTRSIVPKVIKNLLY